MSLQILFLPIFLVLWYGFAITQLYGAELNGNEAPDLLMSLFLPGAGWVFILSLLGIVLLKLNRAASWYLHLALLALLSFAGLWLIGWLVAGTDFGELLDGEWTLERKIKWGAAAGVILLFYGLFVASPILLLLNTLRFRGEFLAPPINSTKRE